MWPRLSVFALFNHEASVTEMNLNVSNCVEMEDRIDVGTETGLNVAGVGTLRHFEPFVTGCGPFMHRRARMQRRRLGPVAAETATSAVHCPTTCRCTARTAAASRSVLDLSCCICSCAAAQRRRPTCARSGAARATCSSRWRCCPWPGRQLPDRWPCPYVTPWCSCAAVLHYPLVPHCTTCSVAQPQSSQCAGQLKPERPSSATSISLSM